MDKTLNETIFFQEKVLHKYIVDTIKNFIYDIETNKEKYGVRKFRKLVSGIGIVRA